MALSVRELRRLWRLSNAAPGCPPTAWWVLKRRPHWPLWRQPRLFPQFPRSRLRWYARCFRIRRPSTYNNNLPVVLNALVAPQLANKAMILMALGTIRAETESFLPISEGQSAVQHVAGRTSVRPVRFQGGSRKPGATGRRAVQRTRIHPTHRPHQLPGPWKRHRAGQSTDRKPRPGQRSRDCRATARQFSEEPRTGYHGSAGQRATWPQRAAWSTADPTALTDLPTLITSVSRSCRTQSPLDVRWEQA